MGTYLLAGAVILSALYPNGIVGKNTLTTQSIAFPAPEILKVWVTAYSSTPEETDDTPFITASGKTVRDGIVATNLLPFATKIKIPKIFGDKIFVVEDRMHRRKANFIDVWMPSKDAALKFGINFAEIEVLN